MENEIINNGYLYILEKIKKEIDFAKNQMMIIVNKEMLFMYYNIGKYMSESKNYGAKISEKLSKDLNFTYPGIKGFSPRNLRYMQQFYEVYQNYEFRQQPVAQLPWGSNIVLLDYVKDTQIRLLFAQKAVQEGWSRKLLLNKIGNIENARTVSNKVTNFNDKLNDLSEDQRNEIYKDPILLSFISSSDFKNERQLETKMTENIIDLLLNFDSGFMLVGKHYRIDVEGEEFFIDLLFYSRKHKRYLVIELKSDEFKPSHTGQITFYMSIVDKYVKENDDFDTVGLLLVRKKNKLIAEISLKEINRPLGVGEYLFKDELPKYLEDNFSLLNGNK